ncbi:MAG: DUF1905 domain-containing protein [Polymorphobacter sp.]|uniref:DUF1905 domain-containing protein n=1 Tax=Polymorphobacter sp. TaxID=1909290 RepID=UPI003A8A1784
MTAKPPPTDPELIRFLREELGESLPASDALHVTGPLWLWRGKAKDGTPSSNAWHFLTIEGDAAEAIRAAAPGRAAAWGSVPVAATIGNTSWQTSVFPSKEAGGYLLPIKASVRKAERLSEGDIIRVTLIV